MHFEWFHLWKHSTHPHTLHEYRFTRMNARRERKRKKSKREWNEHEGRNSIIFGMLLSSLLFEVHTTRIYPLPSFQTEKKTDRLFWEKSSGLLATNFEWQLLSWFNIICTEFHTNSTTRMTPEKKQAWSISKCHSQISLCLNVCV